MSSIEFFVPGTPIAQGSKRHVGNGVLIESAKGLKDWRRAITDAAYTYRFQQEQWTGPVMVELNFYVSRPKSHHVANDPARPKKAKAPEWPLSKPDLDKLTRAVLDAMTDAGVWRDDSQVWSIAASKFYAGVGHTVPGVAVRAFHKDAT